MKINNKKKANYTQLIFDGELTIYHAASIKTEMLSYLNARGAREIEIDLSQVSAFDSAGLQVLLLAKRESLRLDIPLRLVGHSACVLEAFEILNIGAYFGDPLLYSESNRGQAKQHGAF